MTIEIREELKRRNIRFEDLTSLGGDASNRKYYVIQQGNKNNILMFDNDAKNLKNFIKISKYLKEHVSTPAIIKNFKKSGILIIENFNNNKFGEILSKSNVMMLYKIAVDALIYIHKNKPNLRLPKYTNKIFFEESNLFFDWYVKAPKKNVELIKDEFNSIFIDYLNKLSSVPEVFIHRDYHVDNLFFLKDKENHFKCGWIDYQDALFGPCVYDLVSLTQDARIDVDKKLEKTIVKYYLEKFADVDRDSFHFCYSVLAIQRHLKVLGIFSRLAIRDKKKNYLRHIPRVLKLLESNLKKDEFSYIHEVLKYPLGIR